MSNDLKTRATETDISGVLLISPLIFEDERGFFYESWNHRDFAAITGCRRNFVQDNHSKSSFGVLRGLHYQLQYPQGKLIRAIAGVILDVAVDLRRWSPTFGSSVMVELSAENRNQLWVPEGCAHGFLVLSSEAEICYKVTEYYDPRDECCIRWDDPDLAIDWSLGEIVPLVSKKDRNGHFFSKASFYEAPYPGLET